MLYYRFAELFGDIAVGAASGYRNSPDVVTTVSRNFIRRLHLQLDATECRPGTVQPSYENDGLYDCEAYDRYSRSACSTPEPAQKGDGRQAVLPAPSSRRRF